MHPVGASRRWHAPGADTAARRAALTARAAPCHLSAQQRGGSSCSSRSGNITATSSKISSRSSGGGGGAATAPHPHTNALAALARAAAPLAIALAVCASPPALASPPESVSRAGLEYEAQLRRKGLAGAGPAAAAAAPAAASSGGAASAAASAAAGAPRSMLPSIEEADALMALDRDLFTDDGWEGMRRLQRYARYLDALEDAGTEAAPGCEACTANRLLLEQAWQTCAAEFFDPSGRFSQAWWAEQLLDVLQDSGGALRTRGEAYAAMRDLVGRLGDRYSSFLDPGEFRRALRRPLPLERSYLAAQYVGVGIQFGGLSPSGGRVVEAPLSESPAEAAGIMRGDRVLEIEGIPAEQLTMDETTTLLRGPAGSSVDLTVAPRAPGAGPRALTLERRPLPQPPVVDARLPLPGGGQIAYVRLHYFDSAATARLRTLVSDGERDGVAGYILDLRNNAGGVFEEAVAMATLFLPPPADIAETVRGGSPQVIDSVWRSGSLSPEIFPEASRGGVLSLRPAAVLVNSSSASASEVLAGALHDNRRALLIGERTFGKGVIQYYFPIGDDGAGLRLTVSKYLTPSRYDISLQGGLPPDVACRDYPHGVLTPGVPDRCTSAALQFLDAARRPEAGGGGGGGGAGPAAQQWRPLFASDAPPLEAGG